MAWGRARRGLRYWLLGFAPVAAALASTSDLSHAENYSPPTASIVVDGNSGTTLQASNPDAPRHPASLTKIMTLYLLFERLEAGNLRLDSPLNGIRPTASWSDTAGPRPFCRVCASVTLVEALVFVCFGCGLGDANTLRCPLVARH
jgi:D-alanyl-D-alanine carboxypeptidase